MTVLSRQWFYIQLWEAMNYVAVQDQEERILTGPQKLELAFGQWNFDWSSEVITDIWPALFWLALRSYNWHLARTLHHVTPAKLGQKTWYVLCSTKGLRVIQGQRNHKKSWTNQNLFRSLLLLGCLICLRGFLSRLTLNNKNIYMPNKKCQRLQKRKTTKKDKSFWWGAVWTACIVQNKIKWEVF